ncbi:CaiB/BaiF CoA transferase family protein [Pseudonocardia kunmingensis]|uniref:Crotonobetainyl-CoA:carnitine CoA-transferase CaiB-like acyl-CoA transferase n=1 Tax=Pseudonocardia kunmingensis TaxID=630975 RepID=A0A543DVM1_9PSEU|nr:CoA transferase [Pseudonocardia kunmingensis]TQM13372.1 crotonobetainyl-CoA:carnitine CoA-transferase CaiB-like acyl-CoA transferase [Pseudonocardia kunmingensis]
MDQSLKLLEGVRIIAFTQFLLGPAAVQYLADMGADVVKIEPPAGPYERRWAGADAYVNGVSSFFMLAHRNVRSVSLDLKRPEGLEVARELCRNADVVVSNFRPRVMEKLGLDHPELSRLKPDLVYACASGYGSDSPYRDLPGQDLLLQATTGLAAATGRSDGPPVAAGSAIVDQHGASLLAMGILAALHHRSATGEGQRVEVTMVQAALDLQLEPYTYHLNGGTVERPSTDLASSFHQAPYGFYEVEDGYVALSVSPVGAVSQALGDPQELADHLDPQVALTKRNEIHSALAPLLRSFRRAELLDLLRAHGVWCAPVNDYDEVDHDPLVTHLDPVEEIDHPEAGTVRLLKHPIRYSSGAAGTRQVPPGHGEHTDEVLGQAGYSREQVDALRKVGAVT